MEFFFPRNFPAAVGDIISEFLLGWKTPARLSKEARIGDMLLCLVAGIVAILMRLLPCLNEEALPLTSFLV